ncbi:hypothetical protein [Bradyrhizobium jicamae]|uniref:hypothetical protein n=1 Tax=Bradyrhizobium jicamae TaxID=280332 RepID=UPI001BAA4250|nr:hypothetical protein [Bradyrhizobium jicamae]MBR0934852.1 hypothetical protein [Bradyrhizobium jicamae]
MQKLYIELDLDAACERYDIDREGAIELAQQIITKHGGLGVIRDEATAHELFDDLAAHGLRPTAGHRVQ